MSCTPSIKDRVTYHSSDTQYDHRIAYRSLLKPFITYLLFGILALAIASCASQATPYRPPTIEANSTRRVAANTTPIPTPKPKTEQIPTATAKCSDDLTYLEDISIPDGTVVKPGVQLDKRWLIQNTGTCNWDDQYRLKFNSGSDLGAPREQALYPARSGDKATLRIIFTAPTEPGNYRSAWQAYNPQGQPFGAKIYLEVNVEESQP